HSMSLLSEWNILLTQQTPATAPGFVAFVAWITLIVALHVVHNARLRFVLVTARAVMALIFWHQLLQLVSNLVETSRAWPVWLLAGSAAIASEIILLTYDPPVIATVGTMRSWLPKSLVGLRLALVGLIAILLMEPALSREEEKNEERTIAVLVDASSSMTLPTRSGPDPKRSRSEVATNLLSSGDDPSNGLLARIREGYALKVYEFGATARELPVDGAAKTSPKANAPKTDQPDAKTSSPKSQWAQSTDVSAALRRITEDTPTDQLSGVIMLTDGRDHSRTDVQRAVRNFVRQKIPVNSVVIGSQKPIRDADIISLDAPPQIYHGDSVSLQATLRADQLKGTTALVRLYEGDNLLDERNIKIASDKHRESIRFRHEPEDARIHRYRVELSPLDGEETTDNNAASRNVWVSNDRIRVLLIEDRPRWEFRYLRNLFAGRDRTVFLQAVLLRPDHLAGVPVPPVVHASAGRAFDDCDATALPRNEAEWLKFDAVVLGDVSPEQLGANGVRALETFVRKKGGSLVVIAGQNFMPHAYRNSPLADLLPVKLTGPELETAKSPEPSCFLRTTTEGQAHVILQQSDGRPASALQQFPELSWRHPDCEARVGATVLAYASQRPKNDAMDNAPAEEPPQETQRRAALMAWHRFGAGKVLQLNFDESWRLRYGIGDRLHHQFWGQIIRWSVSERLSTGTDLVRMGTDRTLYHSGEPIIVQARLLDDQRNPVTDQSVKAVLLKDNVPARTIDLVPQVDRPGLLQAEIRDFEDPGKYRVELQGDIVTHLLTEDSQQGENVGLEIAIESVTPNDELLDLVADPAIVTQLADATGGIVVTPEDSSAVLKHLGPSSTFHRKRWTVPLWNLWPVISIFLGGLSVEWILRRLLDSNAL
ncbi:MAG: hypothetical protein ACK58L_06355, partial [Planctomycetota bacterium]